MAVKVTETAILETLQRNVNLHRLTILTHEIAKLLMEKNHDYGDAWQRYGLFTPLIRLNDKLLRLKVVGTKGTILCVNESIRDTLRDILGYAILALLWIESEGNDDRSGNSADSDGVSYNSYHSDR